MNFPSTIEIGYQTPPHLKWQGLHEVALSFLKKRMAHFFPETNWIYTPYSEELGGLELDAERGIVLTTLAHPFLDTTLLKRMIEKAVRHEACVEARGEVPGTAPKLVALGKTLKSHAPIRTVDSELQARYNSQTDLGRLKRVRVFQMLLERFPTLHTFSVEDLLNFTGTREGTECILSYGSPIPMRHLTSCPLCGSKNSSFIPVDGSPPMCGFLTRHSKYYFQCQDCELVYLNPQLVESELYRYYDAYSYDHWFEIESYEKYYNEFILTRSPTYRDFETVFPFINDSPNVSALDLGGGKGEFTIFLRHRFPSAQIAIYDFRVKEKVAFELARHDIVCRNMNFLDEPLGVEQFDLVTTWEVIEHLPVERLETLFFKIQRALKPDGVYIFSTPDFLSPYCRALDFWAAFPGEHLSVLSRRVLEPILMRAGFQVVSEHHECITMRVPDRWFLFASKSHSGLAAQAQASIINDFLRDPATMESHHEFLRKNNQGSELILCLKKQ